MLYVVGVEDGQLYGAADAVVGTQCGAFCAHPFAVNVCLYGVFLEIYVHLGQLFAHHIHVALQYNGGSLLHSRCGRLAYEHVARFVGHGFESTLLSE